MDVNVIEVSILDGLTFELYERYTQVYLWTGVDITCLYLHDTIIFLIASRLPTNSFGGICNLIPFQFIAGWIFHWLFSIIHHWNQHYKFYLFPNFGSVEKVS